MRPAVTDAPARAAAGGPAPPRHDSNIFISYRRSDSKHAAGRLHEHLCEYFDESRVFMDTSDIGGGADFVEKIKEGLSSSGAVVVVIGDQWLAAEEKGQRRLHQPGDYVRFEVATGLARGAFVLPVLLGGATMPNEQYLPDDLKPLARRNAIVLSDLHWHEDVELLVSTLDRELIMRGRGLWRALRRLWRRPLVRVAAALLVLAAAFVVQYRLAYRPLPVDLRETNLFTPAVLRAGHDQLVIEGPVTNSGAGLLFSHVGRGNELVDVSCESARLDESTRTLLRRIEDSMPPTTRRPGYDPPAEPGPFAVQTLAPKMSEDGQPQPPQGETCRTSVELSAGTAAAMPEAIHLYKLGVDAGERFRGLEVRAAGRELLLHTVTAMPDEGTHNSPGCRKRTTVGKFEEVTRGTFTVAAAVGDGRPCRFSFNDATPDGPPLWSARRPFQPFDLGGDKLNPGDPSPLRARAVSVISLGGPRATPHLVARAPEGELLSIDSLKVGAEQLQVSISGRGLVKVGGANFVNLSARIRSNPVPALLLALVDLALVIWFLRQLFWARRRA